MICRLAYSELYIVLGTFFRQFASKIKLYKITERDLEYDDFFSIYQRPGRNWLQVVALDYKDEAGGEAACF
jgi:hypothetical protein